MESIARRVENLDLQLKDSCDKLQNNPLSTPLHHHASGDDISLQILHTRHKLLRGRLAETIQPLGKHLKTWVNKMRCILPLFSLRSAFRQISGTGMRSQP